MTGYRPRRGTLQDRSALKKTSRMIVWVFIPFSPNAFVLDDPRPQALGLIVIDRKKKKMRRIAIELRGQDISAYGSDGDKRKKEEKGK